VFGILSKVFREVSRASLLSVNFAGLILLIVTPRRSHRGRLFIVCINIDLPAH